MVPIIDFNRPRDGLTRIDTPPPVWTIQAFAPAYGQGIALPSDPGKRAWSEDLRRMEHHASAS
jgi:hypothetical protein